MSPRAAWLALGLLALAACTTYETPEQTAQRRAASCTAAGFAPGSDSYKLCILLQRNDDRLGAVERRLGFIEQDTRVLPYGYGGPYGYWR